MSLRRRTRNDEQIPATFDLANRGGLAVNGMVEPEKVKQIVKWQDKRGMTHAEELPPESHGVRTSWPT